MDEGKDDEKIEFITDETKQGKVDPADEEVLRSAQTGEGLIQLTPEMFEELAKAAGAAKAAFDDELLDVMTKERALFVRKLRCDEGYSWRALARACHDAWGADWEPPSNQIMGISLCEAAARMLGEDPEKEPWR